MDDKYIQTLRRMALDRNLDAKTAEKLPLNDVRRTIRAIEVTEITGIPFALSFCTLSVIHTEVMRTIFPSLLRVKALHPRTSISHSGHQCRECS